MSDVILTTSQHALEQTGLEFLRPGKFRKARDAFKSLNKSHPARALPLLIEANLGLAQEMTAKGQVNEVNQILGYLKTIAPAGFDLNFTPAAAAKNPRDAWSSRVPQAAQRLATPQPTHRTVRALCSWAGLPNLAEPLLADPLWRKKQHSKAFPVLTNKVPGLFCLGARSFNADLTRLLPTEFIADDLGHSTCFRTELEYVSHRSPKIVNAAMD